jgi:hypothetical protein
MSEEPNQQPVADNTNASAQPDAAAPSAPDQGDDLDKLIAEFDNRNNGQSPPSTPEPKQQSNALEERLQRIEQDHWRRNAASEEKRVVDQLISDNPGLSRRVVTGWINQFAREEPALMTAFQNREQDPRTWDRWQKAIGKEFAKEVASSRIDKAATEDREAVTAAVRGASTKAPEAKPVNYGNMSNAEFRKSVRDQYGFDPGV